MPAAKGQAYNALVAQHLGVHGIQSWQGFLEDYRQFGAEAQDIVETIRGSKRRRTTSSWRWCQGCPRATCRRLYTDYDWNLGRTHCPIAYVEPTIDSDGHVYPCNLFTDEPLAMGNVYGRPSSTSGLGNASRRSAACWRARAGSCRSAIAAANSRKRSPRDTTRGA